jgi:hypothetical protein
MAGKFFHVFRTLRESVSTTAILTICQAGSKLLKGKIVPVLS